MKKALLILIGLFILTGCVNINNLTNDEILTNISTLAFKPNVYKTGYKYYLPRGMTVKKSSVLNEVISSKNYLYYLYVDAISYHNKVKKDYEINNRAFYSKAINDKAKWGYVEINLKANNKYLIEIMYNYAKIEVIVDKKDIKESLLQAINIVKSVKYSDVIIANLLEKNVLDNAEEEYNIFNTSRSDSTYIKIDDTYKEEETTVPDTDLIN